MSNATLPRPLSFGILPLLLLLGSALGSTGCASPQPGSTTPTDGWHVRLDEALAAAKAQQRPVLALFCGSDWCPSCQKMEQNVFRQPAFAEYARENLVLARFDFPKSFRLDPAIAAENARLKQARGVSSFPTVLFLDSEGNEILRTPYGSATAEQYLRGVHEILAEPRIGRPLAAGTMPLFVRADATWKIENDDLLWLSQGSESARVVLRGVSSFSVPINLRLTTFAPGATVHYTLDGSDPTPDSPRADAPIAVSKTRELRARTFAGDKPLGGVARFAIHCMEDTPVPEELLRK